MHRRTKRNAANISSYTQLAPTFACNYALQGFDLANLYDSVIVWLVYSTAIYFQQSSGRVDEVDAHIRKVYVPMTETGFYILLCLQKESHGYHIIRKVEDLTNGEIRISPGTMYGTLAKMEKDGLIHFVREEEKRKIYCITDLGKEILALEMKRIERLYRNMMEVRQNEREEN